MRFPWGAHFWGKSEPSAGAISPPLANQPSTSPAPSPRPPKPRGHDFLDYVMKYDDPDPRMATVRAYLEWMIARKEIGDHEQADLCKDYHKLCDDVGVPAMPRKLFGGAMMAHGCRRRQEDAIRKGKRIRPYIMRIPAVLKVPDQSKVVDWPMLRIGEAVA